MPDGCACTIAYPARPGGGCFSCPVTVSVGALSMITSWLFMLFHQLKELPGSRGRPPRAMHFTP